VARNTNEIQRIITEYFKNIYVNKLEYLEEMDKFLVVYDKLKLNHENISHINGSITSNEIEAAIVMYIFFFVLLVPCSCVVD
jgi:hypothetical protein